MHILKGLLIGILMGGSVLFPAASTEAFSVVEVGDSRSIAESYPEIHSSAANGELLSFVYNKEKRVAYLMNQSKQKTYLTFVPDRIVDGNLDFEIKDIYTTDPDQHLWEVIAKGGEEMHNCGYWIVGWKDGKYVKFVTMKSLTGIGYKSDGRHRLSSKFYDNGNLVLTGSYPKARKGALLGYQKDTVVDFRASFFWDEEKQWFGIRRLNQ